MADEIDSGVIPKNEYFLEEFKEFSEILQIVLNVKDIVKLQVTHERSLERFTYVINQYQEQPHLLDPHLTTLLDELLKSIKSNIHNKLVVHLASEFIYILTKTRGYKVIACILPHEVSDLHVLLSLLSTENFQNSEAFECKYILLLWLSIVCIIPFDLSRFDDADDNTKSSTCDTIYSHGQEYLGCNNRCQEIAALMMARFLSRPDVGPVKLDIFVDWALKSLSGDQSANGSISLTTGVLFAFSYLFKHGRREVMSRHAERIFERIEESHLLANRNTNIRKLSIKVIQRIGLVFLKPRLASWRYKRGLRSLSDNLRVDAAGDCHGFKGSSKVDDDESEIHVPDIIEQVVEKLLVGLRDESTTIRWSSAKGVGRVTGRLPVDLADEVVASVLELFSPSETEDAWHGGCLCLGELGHRGLLLPDRLGEVIPLVEKSLVYDERRGTCSVGGNVRDSASFICWSLARAYDGIILRPFMDRLMRSLVLACLFDREIKARRAASAALQELVGRQGDITNGINIVTTCDYFAVGQRNNCFLQLSMQISEYEGYKEPIIEHLMTKKLCHWDLTIRELASEALGRLASKAVDYFVDSGLKVLLDLSIYDDFSTRHGAVLASSHVLLTLAGIGKENQETDTISCLLTKLKERRYLKGIHGDMMRRAFCFFIRKLSQSKFKPNSWSLIDEWMEFLSECLHNPDKNVQNSSLEAMRDLLVSYRSENIPRIDNLMIECTRGLDSQSDYIRCAYSLLLGDIPLLGNEDHQDRALHLLCQHALFYPYLESHPSDLLAHIRPPLHLSTVEERRDAIRALSRFYQTTGAKEEDGRSGGDDDDLRKIYEVLFVSINDYTIDDRGDVGTGVRESVMSSLYDITHLVATKRPEVLTRQICERIFCHLVQQSTEKIDHTRSKAGEVFFNLLHHSPRIENIPEVERLRSTFPEEEARVINWSSPSDTFPRFARLLTSDVYSYHLLLGTVVSAGGLTEHLVKHSVTSLMNQLKVMTPHQVFQFGKTLVRIFNDHIKVDRVTMPMLKTLDKLLTNDCFSSLDLDQMTELAGDLVKVCTNEVNKSRDVNKIIDSIEVFCCLLLTSDVVRGKCLGQLMVYLCHRFPRIRKCCASRLYEALMVSVADDAENSLDEITDILTETDWDLPVEQLRPIRNNLCSILGVPVPILIEKK